MCSYFRYQVSTDRQTQNSDLDLPDVAETIKSFIVKNLNVFLARQLKNSNDNCPQTKFSLVKELLWEHKKPHTLSQMCVPKFFPRRLI